jgi:hypothetical protein
MEYLPRMNHPERQEQPLSFIRVWNQNLMNWFKNIGDGLKYRLIVDNH